MPGQVDVTLTSQNVAHQDLLRTKNCIFVIPNDLCNCLECIAMKYTIIKQLLSVACLPVFSCLESLKLVVNHHRGEKK